MAHCMVDPDEAYEEARDNKAGFNDWPQDTWRSIEEDPPRIDQVVYATEGKGMWVGRVARGCEEPLIDGLCLENGHAVCVPLRTFTEWRPAPKYKPQKTAEQMFRELGYIKVSGRMYHREGRLYHTYITCLKTATTKVLYRKNGEVVLQATAMENKEILAVARLIEEMEVEK